TSPRSPSLSTLSLHDALPISTIKRVPAAYPRYLRRSSQPLVAVSSARPALATERREMPRIAAKRAALVPTSSCRPARDQDKTMRSEEHTSELQSRSELVCRLL